MKGCRRRTPENYWTHGPPGNSHAAGFGGFAWDRRVRGARQSGEGGGFGDRLIDRALKVGEFPNAGRMVPEEHDPAVREVIQENYRIIYEVLETPPRVFVLRFWHGARGEPETVKR